MVLVAPSGYFTDLVGKPLRQHDQAAIEAIW